MPRCRVRHAPPGWPAGCAPRPDSSSTGERADDDQLAADAEIGQRRDPLLTGVGARRGEQQQVGVFELPADLAAVGTELVSDGLVERIDSGCVRHFLAHCATPPRRCAPHRRRRACHLNLLGLGVYSRLLALLGGDRRGRVGERVDAAAGLRERDHVTDRVHPAEERLDPVPAERDAAVRGGAIREGASSNRSGSRRRRPGSRPVTSKIVFWMSRAVDTNGAAADSVAVADDVVVRRPAHGRYGIEAIGIPRPRRRERVMHRGHALDRRQHRLRRSRRRRARSAAGRPPRRTSSRRA